MANCFFFFLVCVWRMWETNKHTHTNFRVRLFWVKMISGNHFHHFPHVWLSRKISFSGKWLPIDQYFHLWPENHFLPSFSLQITSGKREREKERERRESLDQREREREERAQIAPLVRRSYRAYERRDRWDRAARSTRSRGAIVDRAAWSTSALVGRAPLVNRDRAPRLCRRSAIVGREARSSIAPLVGATRRDLGSLSLIWALSSLSLSLFPKVIWSENEGRKWFPGQRWKYWSNGSHFPENDIFRDSQTLRFYGKWFPETIFTQFKHTLNVFKREKLKGWSKLRSTSDSF